MCSDCPDDLIPNSYISSVHFNGLVKNSNYQIDAKDFKGPLNQQILGAYKFVETFNRIQAVKELGRQELAQFSMRVYLKQ